VGAQFAEQSASLVTSLPSEHLKIVWIEGIAASELGIEHSLASFTVSPSEHMKYLLTTYGHVSFPWQSTLLRTICPFAQTKRRSGFGSMHGWSQSVFFPQIPA
jgi:hypothetical protein